MLKVLIVLSLLMFAPVIFVLVGALLMPLLALLPAVFALGAVLFAVMLGVGGVLCGIAGFLGLFVVGAAVLALGVALTHLLLPLLFIAGLIWLIRRAFKPAPGLTMRHARG